jgi:hypothetical protein
MLRRLSERCEIFSFPCTDVNTTCSFDLKISSYAGLCLFYDFYEMGILIKLHSNI